MARLPVPGSDTGTWGAILNEYLNQSLKSDGSLKDGIVTSSSLASDAVTATALSEGSVAVSALATTNTPATGQVLVYNGTDLTWTTPTAAPVTSVNSQTGAVVLAKGDIGLSNVDNTSDANKPVSTGTQTALDLKFDKSTVTTKGDVLAATGASTIVRVSVGTDGQILTADAASSPGVKWANPAVTSVAGQTGAVTSAQLAADATLNSTFRGIKSWVPARVNDSFMTTRVVDTPTVTWTASSSTALSSPVEYKPPIVDLGSQQTGWDGASDTNIKWYSGSYNTRNGANNDFAVCGETKPGGGAQAAQWPIIIEFNTASSVSVVEVSGYALSNLPAMHIEVNGYLTSRFAITRPSGAGGWSMTMTFPSAAARRIRLWMDGAAGLRAVRVPTGQSISKPSGSIMRRIAFLGDSWANGTGSSGGYAGGFTGMLARMLGADDMLFAGIGGTGFVAGSDGGTPNPYSTRASIINAKSPHILIINGSINDGASGTGVDTAAASLLTSFASIPKIYVIGTMLSGYTANAALVRTATLAASRTYIDLADFISGSGNVGSLSGVGNRDFLLGSDNAHPTDAGHRAIAEAVFSLIYSA